MQHAIILARTDAFLPIEFDLHSLFEFVVQEILTARTYLRPIFISYFLSKEDLKGQKN